MHVATADSILDSSKEAADQLWEQLSTRLGAPPDWIVVAPSVSYDISQLQQTLIKHGAKRFHGSTSCLGAMTERGVVNAEGRGIAAFGIVDPDGHYGVGEATLDAAASPEAATCQALDAALNDAGRPGEVPDLIWISAPPGCEERVISELETSLGAGVPIVGGSSADNDVSGQWAQLTQAGVYLDAIIVSVLFPSTELHFAFHSGYEPTEIKGHVTRADGRILYEIDGRPAAEVYNDWTGGVLQDAFASGEQNVLPLTTLYPLGRVVGSVGGTAYHQLSHPDHITPERGLSLFADVAVGDEFWLMKGTRDSLIERAGRVARAAMQTGDVAPGDIAGGLVIYCAGCMLTVQDQMDNVVGHLNDALGGRPFLGSFTFGEQGCFIGGENRHGNLMISVLLLGNTPV
ncbi:hypothetical protein MNBD_GAMMA20-782 [hydrothermal vent metagenome]|uniref:Histidine kinase n=1 Tax=hydrothermal vent metagenome TaxID=652676 RepID=A0A3B1AFY5_9ZZZZ